MQAEYRDEDWGACTLVDRKDGKKQWARNGMPLYFTKLDGKKGDTNGDGVDGEREVTRP